MTEGQSKLILLICYGCIFLYIAIRGTIEDKQRAKEEQRVKEYKNNNNTYKGQKP